MAPDQEARLRDLEIAFAAETAKTAAALEHLAAAVTTLNDTMQELRDTLNKGKGALWLFGLVASVIGVIASWVMTHILR